MYDELATELLSEACAPNIHFLLATASDLVAALPPSSSVPSSGESVLRQLADEPTGIIAIFGLIIAASLVPAFKGTKNTESIGPLSPYAEMINGRGAMIGFAAMLVIEAVGDKALF